MSLNKLVRLNGSKIPSLNALVYSDSKFQARNFRPVISDPIIQTWSFRPVKAKNSAPKTRGVKTDCRNFLKFVSFFYYQACLKKKMLKNWPTRSFYSLNINKLFILEISNSIHNSTRFLLLNLFFLFLFFKII